MLPARMFGEAQRGEEDAKEGQTYAHKEACEHPFRGEFDQVEHVHDFRGQCDRRTSEEFVQNDLDRVEPVQRLRVRAVCDALAIVTLAKIPQPDLIKIVQADRLGDTINEDGIGYRRGNDVGQLDLEKVRASDDDVVVNVAN